VNLAVEKDDCYKTRFLRAQLYRDIAAYDEAEEEYKNSLYHEETIEALADLMFVEILLNHTFLAIELGEKIRKRKSEDDYWTDNANNLAFLYIDEGEFDEARLLIEECEGEEDTKHSWTDKARKYLKEQMKAAKCVE
jgi:tetratricopeptide (TPR) repeat protein